MMVPSPSGSVRPSFSVHCMTTDTNSSPLNAYNLLICSQILSGVHPQWEGAGANTTVMLLSRQ